MTLSPARPETPPTTSDDDSGHDGPARRGVWSQLRPLVLRLHFYAGVLVAPFILVAAFTGLLYTMSPQLESTAYSAQLTVEPDGPTLPLSEQVAAARDAHPDGELVEVRPPVDEDSSTRVVFTDASVPDGYAMTVFVDPHDARVLGEVRSYGQWLGIRAQLDDLHRNLMLGDVGRHYSELAASWLGVVVLGGLALWFTRRRRDRRLRRLLLPEPVGTGGRGQARRRTLSWHATLGVWVALGALMLSVSGLTWSRYAGENIGDLRTTMGWDTPAVSTSLDGSAPPHGDGHHHGPSGADDAVVTDGVGEVTDTLRFADMPFMAKMTRWVIDAHMGLLFGVANQLALAAVALGLMAGIVLGYRSWWQRRPTRGDARLGRPPGRGAWRRTTWPVRVGIVVVTVALGWFSRCSGCRSPRSCSSTSPSGGVRPARTAAIRPRRPLARLLALSRRRGDAKRAPPPRGDPMQHRKSTTAAVAVLLGLTLSACGGDQSVEEACEIANADAREATESLSSISPTEPEESAAALDELQSTLSETADGLENEEVKTEVQTLADQFGELSSSLGEVAEAGDDPEALQEVSGRLSELGSEIMEQATTLNELCPA